MFTIEVYSTTARKYKKVRTARKRQSSFLQLSLVKGKARVKSPEGVVIATRSIEGKLSLA